jgi:hypothetical protein
VGQVQPIEVAAVVAAATIPLQVLLAALGVLVLLLLKFLTLVQQLFQAALPKLLQLLAALLFTP